MGRYGGEEFLIIVENSEATHVKNIAERCCQELASTPFQSDEATIHVTCSAGIAFSNRTLSTINVLEQADIALYRAKQNGRNQYMVFEEF